MRHRFRVSDEREYLEALLNKVWDLKKLLLLSLRLPYFCLSTETLSHALCSCKHPPHLHRHRIYSSCRASCTQTASQGGKTWQSTLRASCSLQDMISRLRSGGEQGYFGLPNALKPKLNSCRFKEATRVPLDETRTLMPKNNPVHRHLVTTLPGNPANLALQGSTGVTIPRSVQ